jgi:hypothetical protein
VPHFAIEHLDEERLLEAWPVVRMANIHANADWWLSEAAALIDRGGGILAARAADGSIHGVAAYEVARNPRLGRVLSVNTLVTFELSRRAPVRHALCDGLELLASAFDCHGMLLPLPSKGLVRDRVKALYGLIDFGLPPTGG